MNQHKGVIEFVVGLFMLAGIAALLLLAFKVSGLTEYTRDHHYQVTADFDNVGGLRVRAPVRVAGVTIGRVSNIGLDPKTFQAKVTLQINERDDQIPVDSTVSIFTQGLLGSNYISLTPGFSNEVLKANDQISNTHSAMILENLIGQFMFSLKGNDKDKREAKAKDKSKF